MKIKKILVGVAVLLGLLLGTVSVSAQEIVQYVHTDALGSPVAISDANGAIVERSVYEPYGATVGDAKGGSPGIHRACVGLGDGSDVHAAAVLRSVGRDIPIDRSGRRGLGQRSPI